MSNPNPLVPQGSLQEPPKGRKNLPFLVFTIIGLHVIPLSIFLLQGCSNDTTKDPLVGLAPTNDIPSPASAVDSLLGGSNTTASTPTTGAVVNPYVIPAGPAPAPGTATAVPGTPAGYAPAPGTVPAPADPYAPSTTPAPATGPVTGMGEVAPASSAEAVDHKVLKNESFATIAKKHGVTVKAIEQANPGVDSRRLKIGQIIKVPASAGRPAPATAADSTGIAAAPTTYKVKTGDTLTKIAKNNGVSVKTLRSMNGLKTDQIKVGQTLKVPGKPAPAPAPAPFEPAPAPAPVSPVATPITAPPPGTVP